MSIKIQKIRILLIAAIFLTLSLTIPADTSAQTTDPQDYELCENVPSGVDQDQDGIDDSCDTQIDQPPQNPDEETPPASTTPEDPKKPLGESVAGFETLVGPETSVSSPIATSSLTVIPVRPHQAITTNTQPQNNQPVLGESVAVAASPIHQQAEASLAATPKMSSVKAIYILFILIALSILGLAKYAYEKTKD